MYCDGSQKQGLGIRLRTFFCCLGLSIIVCIVTYIPLSHMLIAVRSPAPQLSRNSFQFLDPTGKGKSPRVVNDVCDRRFQGWGPGWQLVDKSKEAIVYSAHYDDVEFPPVVRIVGLALDPLPYSIVWCLYYNGPDFRLISHTTRGNLFHFRGRNGKR